MKKIVLFIFVLSYFGAIAQNPPVAVDDTINVRLGEVVNFNPLTNDYDEDGDPLKLADASISSIVEIFSFTDSIITFKVPDYLDPQVNNSVLSVSYVLDSDEWNPSILGRITIYIIQNDIDYIDANQVNAAIFPSNLQFFNVWESEQSQFYYPKDSTTSTIFCSALWIGGKDADDELHLAADRYRQNGSDFWPGPLSADGYATTDSTNAGNWLRTWKISREEINTHIASYNSPGYEMPEAIENWPAHGDPNMDQDEFIAPFVDVDQDLEYHPELGDYPFIKGDVSVFFVYNDQLTHSETEGQILGVEVHCMVWALENQREVNPYNSTIFYSYKIINRSSEDYYDTYLGIFTDLDLGYAWDDYIGCHVENGNFYVYNGEEIDGNGEPESFGDKIPSQSVCILGGPFIDADNLDNPSGQCDESINGAGFGDGDVDNERYGMSRFIYYSNSGPAPLTDPHYDVDYYNIMQGIWKDGNQMVYGGQGHSDYGGNDNFPARFMFSGDSDPCHWGTNGVDPGFVWSEENEGNDYGDRRGTASMGPFTFEAGSVEYLDIAYVTAPYSENKASKELLQDFIAEIKQDYLEDPMDFGFQYTGIEDPEMGESLLEVYPNPVDGNQIWFELDETENAEYIIYNSAGQQIQSGKLPAQKQHQLNVETLNSGWYLLEIKTSNKTYRSKLIK